MWWLSIQESKQRPIKNNLRQVILLRAVRFLVRRKAATATGAQQGLVSKKNYCVWCSIYCRHSRKLHTLGKAVLDLVNKYRWETQPTCEYISLIVQELIFTRHGRNLVVKNHVFGNKHMHFWVREIVHVYLYLCQWMPKLWGNHSL